MCALHLFEQAAVASHKLDFKETMNRPQKHAQFEFKSVAIRLNMQNDIVLQER